MSRAPVTWLCIVLLATLDGGAGGARADEPARVAVVPRGAWVSPEHPKPGETVTFRVSYSVSGIAPREAIRLLRTDTVSGPDTRSEKTRDQVRGPDLPLEMSFREVFTRPGDYTWTCHVELEGLDARQALAASVGKMAEDPRLDLDGDGHVTSRDATLIQRLTKGFSPRDLGDVRFTVVGLPPAAATIAAPDVIGLSSSQAREKLAAAGFQAAFVPSSTPTPSKEAECTAESQDPAAGTKAARGSSVTVSLYQGAGMDATQTTEVPGVVSLKTSDARFELKGAGLGMACEANNEDPQTADDAYTVKTQSPQKGTSVPRGSIVVVRLYGAFKGPDPQAASGGQTGNPGGALPSGAAPPPQATPEATVPNVMNMKEADARAAIERLDGLEVIVDHGKAAPSEDRVGRVYAQIPTGGSHAPADGVVAFSVYTAPRPASASGPASKKDPSSSRPPSWGGGMSSGGAQGGTKVPGVIGMTKGEAARAMGDTGVFRLQWQEGMPAPGADQVGRVYHQEPAPNGLLADTSMVTLWLYGEQAVAQGGPEQGGMQQGEPEQGGAQPPPPPCQGPGGAAAGGDNCGENQDDEDLKALQAFLDELNKGLQQSDQDPPPSRRRRHDHGAPSAPVDPGPQQPPPPSPPDAPSQPPPAQDPPSENSPATSRKYEEDAYDCSYEFVPAEGSKTERESGNCIVEVDGYQPHLAVSVDFQGGSGGYVLWTVSLRWDGDHVRSTPDCANYPGILDLTRSHDHEQVSGTVTITNEYITGTWTIRGRRKP